MHHDAQHARRTKHGAGVRASRGRAFTLLELLVCVAVIGVLAGLVAGAARHAVHASHRAVCANNLRWLHGAVAAYMQDHRETLPWAVDPYSLAWDRHDPVEAIAPYLDVAAPFIDEEDVVVTGQPWECPASREVAGRHGSSYDYPPHRLMLKHGRTRVTRFHAASPWQPIWMDREFDAHPGAGKMAARFDGAVGRWSELRR
ncbi:MAG: type II secretion system protein [Phycisphaerales bacterium]|nr:MAG: type II secretion system protein [Phycisphaerales bacterium]